MALGEFRAHSAGCGLDGPADGWGSDLPAVEMQGEGQTPDTVKR